MGLLEDAIRPGAVREAAPGVSLDPLRQSSISLLVEGSPDVYQIFRRIGHGSASLTLKTLTHLFRSQDTEAAEAIEAVLRN